MPTFNTIIEKLIAQKDLSEEEAQFSMNEIMEGKFTPVQIASYLTALRIKGESVSEISASASVMREKAETVSLSGPDNLIDTCGTGGDRASTFNISTAAALVVAGAGGKVAKHGNRSVSSSCGSADVLQELGVNIALTPEQVGTCIDKVGFGFLFAPIFHKAMKHAVGPRRELGIRTVFNLLGPLTNPARASTQVLGVYAPELTEVFAEVSGKLGCQRVLAVHGLEGLDEVSPQGATKVSELRDGLVSTYEIGPEDFGIKPFPLSELKGGNAGENAGILLDVLHGRPGAARKAVIMNAACAFVAAGMADNFEQGANLAAYSIDSRKAIDTLNHLIEYTGRYGQD
ncbi:MAG: anthranilate phosphoribosyltransferase [bacterium]